jgi:putative alpha-1,2-mannosidase
VINAPTNSEANKYIQAVTVDGKTYNYNWFSHAALQKGAVLNFNMSAQPNKQRGISTASVPFSMSDK